MQIQAKAMYFRNRPEAVNSVRGIFELQFKRTSYMNPQRLRQIAGRMETDEFRWGVALLSPRVERLCLVYDEHVHTLGAIEYAACRATRSIFVCCQGHGNNLMGLSLGRHRALEFLLRQHYHTLKNLFHIGRPIPCELFVNASVSLS